MRKWVCDRCNKELQLSEVTMEFEFELCKSCAKEFETIIDNFFKSKPVDFPNSEPIQRKLPGCRLGECKDCVNKNRCSFSSASSEV